MAKKSKTFIDKDKNKFKIVYEINGDKEIECTLWKNYGKLYNWRHSNYSYFKNYKKIMGLKFFKELQNIINLIDGMGCFK